jgi:hypothetical protein
MSTQFFNRPSAGYTGEAGLSNRTKYNDDSTASPRRPISSTKIDGDFNYLIDAVNTLYDTAVSGVVADNSITDAKLRDSAGLSVIGRSANTSGNPADIVAASDNQVLRRSGTSIGFGQVATAGVEDAAITSVKIADTNVTFTKIQNVNTGVVLGRSSSGAGSVEALTVSNGLTVSSGALSGVAATDSAVGVAELATVAETRTGSDAARVVTPAGLLGALGVSYMAESTGNSISNSGLVTFAHGLGRAPKFVQFHVVCASNDAASGYVSGDVIYIDGAAGNNSSSGYQAYFGATNVNVRFGVSFGGYFQRKSDGAQVGVSSLANFTLTIRAWA